LRKLEKSCAEERDVFIATPFRQACQAPLHTPNTQKLDTQSTGGKQFLTLPEQKVSAHPKFTTGQLLEGKMT